MILYPFVFGAEEEKAAQDQCDTKRVSTQDWCENVVSIVVDVSSIKETNRTCNNYPMAGVDVTSKILVLKEGVSHHPSPFNPCDVRVLAVFTVSLPDWGGPASTWNIKFTTVEGLRFTSYVPVPRFEFCYCLEPRVLIN